MHLRIFTVLSLLALSGNYLSAQELLPAAPSETGAPSSAGLSSWVQDEGTYHSGYASLRPDGSVHGKVTAYDDTNQLAPVADALVTIRKDKSIVDSVSADENGNFVVEGLAAGVYELIAETNDSFAAYAFQAVPVTATDDSTLMNVYAATMSRADVERSLREAWAPRTASMEMMPVAFQELQEPALPDAPQTPRVKAVGGLVQGQVAFPHTLSDYRGHIVNVYSDGKLIATEAVDALGQFALPVGPGVIDVLVGGTGYYGAYGVEVVADDTEVAANNASGERFVTAKSNNLVADKLFIPVIPNGDVVQNTNEEIVMDQPMDPLLGPPIGPPMGGAPAGGGGFGGGGGGFGGGGGAGAGIGGGLGIAGLAVGVAALADNDDGFNLNQATIIVP